MAELRDGVPLTELGVITRWSLAVRQSEAERADLIDELKADLAWLERNSPRQAAPAAASAVAPAQTEDIEPEPGLDDGPEFADAPVRKAAAPLRRLPKAAPRETAPRKAAPAKAAPARTAAKTTPAKAAAPRGRRSE